MKQMVNMIRSVRGILNRTLYPNTGHWLPTRSLVPLSRSFGFNRGTPIDRFWIEAFLAKSKQYITGNVLEIGDRRYTQKFGTNIKVSDVLDIDSSNQLASHYGSLTNLKKVISDNSYDCLVVTHVLGQVDDVEKAIAECKRILKPGGVFLVTSACFSPTHDQKSNLWRFTPAGARVLFEKYFPRSQVDISSYGNVLTGQAFWVGLAREELTLEELEYNDPSYPCIVTIKAVK